MTPKELRAFRESLGLSRSQFAPKLFISVPTLERWERGLGGPHEIHLHVLRRMRECIGARLSIDYFRYDGTGAGAGDLVFDDRQVVIETLRGTGAVVLAENQTCNGRDWSVRFGLRWVTGGPVQSELLCEGSDRIEWPVIDFTLEITAECKDGGEFDQMLPRICYNHRICWKTTRQHKDQLTILLSQRVFRTGLNPLTIGHVLANQRSCWDRLKGALEDS